LSPGYSFHSFNKQGIFVAPAAGASTPHRCVSDRSLCGAQYCNPSSGSTFACEVEAGDSSVSYRAPCSRDAHCVGWDAAPVPSGAENVACIVLGVGTKTCRCDYDYAYDAPSGFCVFSMGDRL
jgi:hypothetical protein